MDNKTPAHQRDRRPSADLQVHFADTYEPTGPWGAKGIGEAAMNPVAAAYANAIYSAIGIRFRELPMTPEKILAALGEHEQVQAEVPRSRAGGDCPMNERENTPYPMTNSHSWCNEFDYLEPATLDEAVRLLSEHGTQARILAGGTDLLVQMKMERIKPAVVISIRRIPGLDAIELRGDGLHIGALATIHAIRGHPAVRSLYPALAQACASFSTTQVQVMGTVGGNLCNASPASDTAPALIAYDAEAVLRGPGGERRLPVEALFAVPASWLCCPANCWSRSCCPCRPTALPRHAVGSARPS